MENNTDIIVLTSIVIVLFLVFIIATVRELNNMTTSTDQDKKESGPRAEMLRLVGKLFTDERIDPVKRITFMNAIKPMIDDMAEDEEKKKS